MSADTTTPDLFALGLPPFKEAIAVVQCGTTKENVVIPEGFEKLTTRCLDNTALLRYQAIIFLIESGRKRFPKWLDHDYLRALADCGLKVVIVLGKAAPFECMRAVVPSQIEIYQFAVATEKCWGLETDDELFSPVTIAPIRTCFRFKDGNGDGLIIPVVSKRDSKSFVAFEYDEKILYLQGDFESLAECAVTWAFRGGSGEVGIPAAPRRRDPTGVAAGSLFRYPSLLKACLLVVLASFAVTHVPTWLRQSQIANNLAQREMLRKPDDIYGDGEPSLTRISYPDYREYVDSLESGLKTTARLGWSRAKWNEFANHAGRSESWHEIYQALTTASFYGHLSVEKKIYELASQSDRVGIGDSLNSYVFIENWQSMIDAFLERDFDAARTRAEIIISWWTRPNCNWIHYEHNRKVHCARIIHVFTGQPTLAACHQEIIDAIGMSIREGTPFVTGRKIDDRLLPFTDYLELAEKSSSKDADPLKVVEDWEDFLQRYPDSAFQGEVLQNQMTLWARTSLRLIRGDNRATEVAESAEEMDSGPESLAESSRRTPRQEVKQYIARAGDSYMRVASAFGVSVEDLRAANNDVPLRVGLILRIPTKEAPHDTGLADAAEKTVSTERPLPGAKTMEAAGKVDWAFADKIRDHATHKFGPEYYLLDDIKLLRVIVSGSSGDTERTATEIRSLFSEQASDGSLRFIDRILGPRTGSAESFARARAIARRWVPMPELKKGSRLDRFELLKMFPGLDTQTVERLSQSDLLAEGTYQGDSFEYLLAKIFELKFIGE